MSSKLITNKLGLNAEASEDSIINAIDAIINKDKSDKIGLEGKIADLEKKMTDAKAEYDKACDDLNGEMDKLKKEKAELAKAKDDMSKEKDAIAKAKVDTEEELDKMKKEKDAAELATKEEKYKNVVADYAKVGRITAEQKVLNFWTAQFMADPVMAKEQIEALPLNKIAPVINKIEPSLVISAAGVMAKLNQEYQKEQKQNIN